MVADQLAQHAQFFSFGTNDLTQTTFGYSRDDAEGKFLGQYVAEGILPQKRDPRVSQHAYHLFIFRYDPDTFNGMTRDEFLVALEAEGIPCARGYVPLYETKAIQDGTTRLRKFIEGREVTFEMPDCPVTEKACAEEGVWLTQRVLLGSRADMDDVVTAVRKVQHDSWHR